MKRATMTGAALLSLSVIATSLQGCGAGGGPLPGWPPWQPRVGALTLSPAGSNYALRKIGTSSPPHTFTLTNPSTNNAAAVIERVEVTDSQFSIDGATTTCTQQQSVPIGGSCQIGVRFSPTAKGPVTALLEITDNASNSPQTANLAGAGK